MSVEAAKRAAARAAVAAHFSPSYTYVGIGSGTTIIYVVDAIKDALAASSPRARRASLAKPTSTAPSINHPHLSSSPSTSAVVADSEHDLPPHHTIHFVPTGYQSRQVILKAGLTPTLFDHLPDAVVLDVAFDGADEVDEELNCIKGGGACLFQEKLVAERARRFVCVADYRKSQPRLLTSWPTIPIEVAPIAVSPVLRSLKALGSPDPIVRPGALDKSGPLKTDQDFFIIDAPFPTLLTTKDVSAGAKGDGSDGKWEVQALSRAIKAITGVLEVGLFAGSDGDEIAAKGGKAGGQKPVAVYFGMEDGSVVKRTQGGDEKLA